VPAAIERTLCDHAPPAAQKELSSLISAFGSRFGMLALCGKFAAFEQLNDAEREVAFAGMRNSMFAPKRKAFLALKGLVAIKAFGDGADGGNNPNWSALGYPGPASDATVQQALEGLDGRDEHVFSMINQGIEKDVELAFDAVVVGSGSGGAVAAAELAAAGRRVLVLDKGAYLKRAELSGIEGDALNSLYERGGLVSTEDTGIAVLAASTFGGGPTVNWACSLRTPDHVCQEWATEHGLPRFATDEFRHALDAVCERISVKAEGVSHNRNNQLLLEGCDKLGYSVDVAPQNMADVTSGAPGAGNISIGDRYANKQSMIITYLRDAATAAVPAQFADRCRVSRVLHSHGIAQGVEAQVAGPDGKLHKLTVRSPLVVVACGSIHSPALLLRSGLPNKNGMIGKNLRLHPVSAVTCKVARGEVDVYPWEGAPMTIVSNVAAKGPTGDNYGAKLECPASHPGLMSTATAWVSGRQFKQAMLDQRRISTVIILTRDRGSGEVRLDKEGEAQLYYPLAESDRQSMLDGMEKAIRVCAINGAEEIGTTQLDLDGARPLPPTSMPSERAAAVDALIANVRRIGFPLAKANLFSAHQMGTCKMGGSPKNSVVDSDGQSWEVKGLFVSDASTFPTSSGTNPMVTTLAISYLIAQQMKTQLSPVPPSKL